MVCNNFTLIIDNLTGNAKAAMVMTTRHQDEGFTLIEMLMVVLVLGILSVAVVASVGGFSSAAEDSSCAADAHILGTASEAFFADRSLTAIPATGTSADRFEATLVSEGFMRTVSEFYDLDAAGQLMEVTESPCVA